jgi:prepilin-type N-terminal cleavage/methylation domain-containing protein
MKRLNLLTARRGSTYDRTASRSRSRGFTLLESAFAIVVLSVLLGIVPLLQKARVINIETAMPDNLKSLELSLEEYEAAITPIPPNYYWQDILPYIHPSFDLVGNKLQKDGYSFTLVGGEATEIAQIADASTKVIKGGKPDKHDKKVQVIAEPLSPMCGSKTYVFDYKDGSIKSTTDLKLVAEQEKTMIDIQKKGTEEIFAASKELIEEAQLDYSVAKLLKSFPDEYKKFANEYVGGADGKVTLDTIKALAGDESEPPANKIEETARYFKHKLDIGIGNEKTDGSNGTEVEIGEPLSPEEMLTWSVFRAMVSEFLEDHGLRDALLMVSESAEKSEQMKVTDSEGRYDILRKLIDTALLAEALSIKEAIELHEFVNLRSEIFGG